MNEWWLLLCFWLLMSVAIIIIAYPLRHQKIFVILLSSLLILVLAGGYWYWGAWTDWWAYQREKEKRTRVEAILKSVRSPEDLINNLRKRLDENRASAEGWYLLGRLYASQNDWKNAKDAFDKAQMLEPKNEKIVLNYIQSAWQVNGMTLDNKSYTKLQAILENNPNQPDALAILATDAYKRKAYQQAIDYWQRLLQIVPPDSEDVKAIHKAIVKAKQQLPAVGTQENKDE